MAQQLVAVDELAEGGAPGPIIGDRRRLFIPDGVQDAPVALSTAHGHAAQGQRQDRQAEAPHVAAEGVVHAGDPLGRHVGHGAHEGVGHHRPLPGPPRFAGRQRGRGRRTVEVVRRRIRALVGVVAAAEAPRHAEVADTHGALAIDENVGRLEVAMQLLLAV
eukprot:scaffold336_cov250-Pinguiococcus_pyrenoidosus.AAC.21